MTVNLQDIDEALNSAQAFLLNHQSQAGYWVGELESDASVSAGYLPLLYFMLGGADPARQAKVVHQLWRTQNPDGSWSTYPGGPGDLNVSIQVYFALKLAGVSQEEPALQRTLQFILSRGGLDQVNVFTGIWLALFGQYEYRNLPSIPPELILLPNNFIFSIYDFASWSRETIMALCLVLAIKPVCELPTHARLDELRLQPAGQTHPRSSQTAHRSGWKRFFLVMDRLFKTWEKLPFQPGRRLALRKVEQWVVEHQEEDGSWGGIMLPWIYSLMALKSMGYGLDHPVISKGLKGLEDFIKEDADTLRLQPSVSPVWDTAWAVIALRQSGLPADHPRLQQSACWLLDREIREGGDWQIKNPHTQAGGWSFEFANRWYPDLDDSAVVPRALLGVRLPEALECEKFEAIQRAIAWTLDLQSKDGGWAAFDRDNDKVFLDQTPFADFMSPLDPTCADVTAHMIELLTAPGLAQSNSSVAALERAHNYIKLAQETDGAWFGRWGVNYLYGTGLTLSGLAALGEDAHGECMRRGVDWLLSRQNPDGGWGETCATYLDHSLRGKGPSTASQTAWALIGLIAAGEQNNPAVQNGLQFLIETQKANGDWQETHFTGTGFPGLFYLRYDLYRVYFPLLALARYKASHLVTAG